MLNLISSTKKKILSTYPFIQDWKKITKKAFLENMKLYQNELLQKGIESIELKIITHWFFYMRGFDDKNEICSKDLKWKVEILKNPLNSEILTFRVDSDYTIPRMFYNGSYSGECIIDYPLKESIRDEKLVEEKYSKLNPAILSFIFMRIIDTWGLKFSWETHHYLTVALKDYLKGKKDQKKAIQEYGELLLKIIEKPEEYKEYQKKYYLREKYWFKDDEIKFLSNLRKNPSQIYSSLKKLIFIVSNASHRGGDNELGTSEYKRMHAYNLFIILNPNCVTYRFGSGDFGKGKGGSTWGEFNTKHFKGDIFGIVCILNNKEFCKHIVEDMLKATEEHPERRPPIYDCNGNLIWPG